MFMEVLVFELGSLRVFARALQNQPEGALFFWEDKRNQSPAYGPFDSIHACVAHFVEIQRTQKHTTGPTLVPQVPTEPADKKSSVIQVDFVLKKRL